jgi:hypothetical protein
MILGKLIIASFALAAVGILLVSFVQTKFIKEHGIWHFQKRGFINVYWHDRTKAERRCFWVGLVLFSVPFVIVGIWRLLHV